MFKVKKVISVTFLHPLSTIISILLLLTRKITGFYIANVLLNRVGNLFVKIQIRSQKSWFEFCINPKHIVHHQHIAKK